MTGETTAIAIKTYIDRQLNPIHRIKTLLGRLPNCEGSQMSPNQRVFWGAIVFALSFVPAGADVWGKVQAQSLNRQQQESQLHGDQVKEDAIERNSVQTARDEKIALKRADRCILIDEQFPLVEGGNAFYNPRDRKGSRLLPANTALCSAQSGYTALVDEAGTVSNIKQAPIEKLTESLKRRGVVR